MADDESNTNGRITYTTKEVVTRIEAKLDTLTLQLEQKASHADLEILAGRVGVLERAETQRQTKAEIFAQTRQSVTEWKRWAIPTVLTAAFTTVVLVQAFH